MREQRTTYTGSIEELEKYTKTHSADMASLIAAGHRAINGQVEMPDVQPTPVPTFDQDFLPCAKRDGNPETL